MSNTKRNLIFLFCLVLVSSVAATIGTLTPIPDGGGVFTSLNHDTINSNVTQSNTNFTNLNNAVGGGLNGLTITSTTGTLTIAALKTLTASNTLTLAGTDATTITFPAVSVSMIGTSAYSCGATTTCANTAATAQKVITGSGQLSTGSPSTFVLTGISPAFTSSSTFICNAVDTTTAANNISVLTAGYVSGSAVTFTGPNTNTDTFRYSCVGN